MVHFLIFGMVWANCVCAQMIFGVRILWRYSSTGTRVYMHSWIILFVIWWMVWPPLTCEVVLDTFISIISPARQMRLGGGTFMCSWENSIGRRGSLEERGGSMVKLRWGVRLCAPHWWRRCDVEACDACLRPMGCWDADLINLPESSLGPVSFR